MRMCYHLEHHHCPTGGGKEGMTWGVSTDEWRS